MNLDQFTKEAFESRGINTDPSRELANALEQAVLQRIHQAAQSEFTLVVSELNALGHRLQPYGEISTGDISYRDEPNPGRCFLRLGCDLIVSAGYAHTQDDLE